MLLVAAVLEAADDPTKTRCHKLFDEWGKWKPLVRVAEDPASNFEGSGRFFRLSAECDLILCSVTRFS